MTILFLSESLNIKLNLLNLFIRNILNYGIIIKGILFSYFNNCLIIA